MSCNSGDFRIAEPAFVDPAESLKVTIDCYDLCALKWKPNEAYSAAEYVRPQVPNGFSYEITVAGTSGNTEPRWPTVVATSVVNGSATFTCRAPSAGGVNAMTGPSAVSEPTGLTISSVSVSESTKLLATYSGGTEGQSYNAVFSFTLDGVTRIARQVVNVRKR